MSELPSQALIVHNQSELEDLAWELESAEGQFSLMLARCNYARLRDELVEHLRQICSVVIRVLVLQPSETALYSRIQGELKGEQPGALMVFGLEAVADLEQLLSNANQVREEFRKNCPFPIVLWVTDDVLRGLVHSAPDLESWATKTHFTMPPEALLQSLQQAADSLFTQLLTPGSSQSFEQLHKKMELEFLRRDEVRMAVQDLQRQEQVLELELQASLNFARGLNATAKKEALEYFQQSLNVWQGIQAKASTLNAPTAQLKSGLLLFYIGQTTYQICEQDKQPNWEAARVPLQQCVELFERENRPDLVSKCITEWAQVLWQLQRWDELETLANKALKLHQTAIDSHLPYASLSRLAQDYGFLADVELQRQRWTTAAQFAQLALNILNQRSGETEWVQSQYLLLLAQAERQLGQLRTAEEHLLQAKSLGDRGHPQTYLSILQALRELYLEERDYAKAFAAKQERFSIEQQYGIRAFVGAGRLQPGKQAVSTGDRISSQGMVAPEIAAAGRQQDLDRLLERVERRDYRFIVIHGNSGVGKSSLVNAGLVPTLKQKTIEARGNVPVVMRVYTQWMQELGRLLAEAIGKPPLNTQPFTSQTLLERLRQIDQCNLRAVLIFDQFEEFFFVYPKPENRKPFFDFLTQCLQILSIKVFLSLREDYLHYLLECNRLEGMKRMGIDVLSQNVLYGLGNLDPQDAKAIIQSLTDRARFFLEPALVDQLVEDLAREAGTVRPIELQVLGAQLQVENITSLVQYRALGQEPKQELVKRCLDEIVADCGTENQQIAQLVLFLLTDEKGTRPLKTRTELEKELQALAIDLNEQDSLLDLVLRIFVDSGLVFLLPELPADRYQLVHDYLATFIRQQQEPKLNQLLAELERERSERKLSEERLARVGRTTQILTESRQKAKYFPERHKQWISWQAAMSAIFIAVSTISIRATGMFQILELAAYDRFFQLRPLEPTDDRIIIVSMGERDLNQLGSYPISDKVLAQLLQKIQTHQPLAIGLDFYRNLPQEPGHDDLLQVYKTSPNLIGAEHMDDGDEKISAPPILDKRNQIGNLAVPIDLDGKFRRELLTGKWKGEIHQSFSLALALYVLEAKGITPHAVVGAPDYYNLGKGEFHPFHSNEGGNVNADDRGYQLLVNFRGPANTFRQVSMTDVLNNRVSSGLFHDRIVLIGYTALSSKDFYLTPYSRTTDNVMFGVELQANLVSQILSSALDGRPLLQGLPIPLSWLWIIFWCSLAASLSWASRSPILVTITTSLISTGAFSICYIAFLHGWWLPLVPPIFAISVVSILSAVLSNQHKSVEQLHRSLQLTVDAYREDPAAGRLAVEIFLITASEGNVAAEEIAKIAIAVLQNCSTPEDIAAVSAQLSWIPSPPPKSLSPEFLSFLEVSHQVQTAFVHSAFSSSKDELLGLSITTLQHLQKQLNNIKRSFRNTKSPNIRSLKLIASKWLIILTEAKLRR